MNPRPLPCLAGALLAFAATAADTPYRANRDGLERYASGRYGEAQASFQAGLENPDATRLETSVLAYNEGLAQAQQGSLDAAAASFQRALAAPDAALRARAAYAAGNLEYQRGEKGGEEAEALQQAIAAMERAQEHYETALHENPALSEAAANHELAQMRAAEFRKKLEELEKQQQDQQDQQNQDEKKKDQEKKDQEKKDQEKKEPQQKDSESGQDPQKQDPEQGQGQPPPQPSDPKDGNEDKQDSRKPEEGDGKQDPSQGGQGEPQDGKDGQQAQSAPGQPQRQEMTPEQARMMLNALLNDEKQQREAVRVRLMQLAPDIPVEKDY